MAGFGALDRVIKNVRKLSAEKILHDALNNSQIQRDIINLNTEKQLYEQGLLADGKETGQYSSRTITGVPGKYKGKLNAGPGHDSRIDHITLKDTGAMYESEKIILNADGSFVMSMNTVKGGVDLTEREGKIVGLTEESLGEVRSWVLPIMQRKTLEQILK